MIKNNVVDIKNRDAMSDTLAELLTTGARQLIQQAVQVELEEFMSQYSNQLTTDGKAAVVRNGYQPEREILTGIGSVPVKIPKVRSKDGKPVSFHSALVPPYVRKAKSVEASLPWLYLKGVPTGEMSEALKVLVGSDAKGLSASAASRLKQEWGQE